MKRSQSEMKCFFRQIQQPISIYSAFLFSFFFSGIFSFEPDLERDKENHRGKHERPQINLIRTQCFYPKPAVFQDSILPFGFLKKKAYC